MFLWGFSRLGANKGSVIARPLRYSAIVRVNCSVPFIVLSVLVLLMLGYLYDLVDRSIEVVA